MNPDKIQYREGRGIKLFDFLALYRFTDDWINKNNEHIADVQLVEIRYKIKHEYSYEERFFQFGVDDSYIERSQRQGTSSWSERQRGLSETLPERFRNKEVASFWVDASKNMLIVEVYGDEA